MRAKAGANDALAEARPPALPDDGKVLPLVGTLRQAKSTSPRGAGHWLRSHRRQALLAAFVLPALAYVVIFFAYPLIYGVTLSLEKIGFIAQIGRASCRERV